MDGSGGSVVLMRNYTFYNGTVGDNTTWFFMTNFTQVPDLFLSVYLIGHISSNETESPAIVQMFVVDDDNHAVGIVTTGKVMNDFTSPLSVESASKDDCLKQVKTRGPSQHKLFS